MILGTWPANSPEWLAARAGRIGGSSIAAVCGWSPFQSRDDLLAEMSGAAAPRAESKSMRRGTFLEDAIATWWAADHDAIFDPEASAATHVHEQHPWAIFNPDRVTTDGELLEVKTTHNRETEAGWGRAGTDRVPLVYAAQVQWGCGIGGWRRWHLTVLHGATNGRPDLQRADYRGEFQPDHFAFMLRKAGRFIDELNEIRSKAA